ncbi:hypothetical protein A2881_01440 [Candidatus Peribacteria bacterium RIFCSPHIGHO2_01_FULL_55_13]|nr:MAG: hypothetical protein A2881_01440 [Candidatus Peribacteria bacterium RIFCSPHIGHO2_01_FULL_55_13]OGJ64894.1 MAG: hypothetical protein A3F36_01990 [Candidatus Peribacteria bacterium RIFCSPHIGHO2_12_FULL_55_11]
MKNSFWLARMIGSGLAHVQHAIDEAADTGFRMLRKAGTKTESVPKPEKSRVLGTLKRTGKSTLRFLGETGESYYQKYDDLKNRKKGSS